MRRWMALIVLTLAGTALAVMPKTWRHASEADFASGEFTDAAVSSRGEISLARRVEVLLPAQDAPAVVSAVVAAGQSLYAASGADSQIYKITGKKVEQFASPPGTIVTALVWTGKDLVAGTGGAKGAGIYRISAQGVVKAVWSDPAAWRYRATSLAHRVMTSRRVCSLRRGADTPRPATLPLA